MKPDEKLTGYELARDLFEFSFENPDLVKPVHIAIYFFAVEHCNRLGWKPKFGFPTQMTMEAIGVKNWRTYIKAFNELVDWGFFELIEKSKNQYSSNIIAIVKNTKANTKALSKASQKHLQKQVNSTDKSIVSIDKQLTIEQENFINEINKDEVLKSKYLEYTSWIRQQTTMERIGMKEKLNPKHMPLLIEEFIDRCYGEIMEQKNKYIVENYFINWVKKEGRIIEAINNQMRKQNEQKKQ